MRFPPLLLWLPGSVTVRQNLYDPAGSSLSLSSPGGVSPTPHSWSGRGVNAPDTHQRRFLLGQCLITQDHLRQVLGLPRVDPAVRAETELARHGAVDAVDRDLEATGDLLGRKARVFTLRLAGRRVFARGFQPGIDPRFVHRSRPPAAGISRLSAMNARVISGINASHQPC